MEGKVNKKIKYGLAGILSSAVIMSSALTAGADTSVYAEGAYNDTDLDVYVYADIPDALVSMGIRVAYDSTKFTAVSAEKNEAVWYFGDSTTTYPYKDPEDDGSGVVILGGKIDTGDPTAGVTGSKVLLGKIHFTRVNSDDPWDGGGQPEDFFGITVGLGIDGGTYANFVQTDGTVQEDTGDLHLSFDGVTIREYGDANADGVINVNDIRELRKKMSGAPYVPYVDCNGDGSVNVNDIRCLRRKI
jgi:hypothetical protein